MQAIDVCAHYQRSDDTNSTHVYTWVGVTSMKWEYV